MKPLVLCLFLFLPSQGKPVDFDGDLFHLTVLFIHAESVEKITSIRDKISQLEERGQIKDDNREDVRAFKKEIDQFILMEEGDKQKFIILKNKFNEIMFLPSKNQQEFSNRYFALLPIEKQISGLFAKESAIGWIYKMGVMDSETQMTESRIVNGDIEDAINAYSKTYGDKSLFLTDLYLYLTRKLLKSGDFKGALDACKKANDLVVRYTSKRSSRFYFAQCFAMKCYTELGDRESAKQILSSIDVNELYRFCEGMPYELYIFNASASALSENSGKSDNAILFQEAAITYLENIVDKANPGLVNEINKLRGLFAKKGDWISVGKLEDKYKLKPLPR